MSASRRRTSGLEQKLIAVPINALRVEIALIVRAMVRGLEGELGNSTSRP